MMNFLEERWLRIRETTGIHKYDPKDKPAEREVKGVIFFKKEKKGKKEKKDHMPGAEGEEM